MTGSLSAAFIRVTFTGKPRLVVVKTTNWLKDSEKKDCQESQQTCIFLRRKIGRLRRVNKIKCSVGVQIRVDLTKTLLKIASSA